MGSLRLVVFGGDADRRRHHYRSCCAVPGARSLRAVRRIEHTARIELDDDAEHVVVMSAQRNGPITLFGRCGRGHRARLVVLPHHLGVRERMFGSGAVTHSRATRALLFGVRSGLPLTRTTKSYSRETGSLTSPGRLSIRCPRARPIQ